jgi:hypothetical protein
MEKTSKFWSGQRIQMPEPSVVADTRQRSPRPQRFRVAMRAGLSDSTELAEVFQRARKRPVRWVGSHLRGDR